MTSLHENIIPLLKCYFNSNINASIGLLLLSFYVGRMGLMEGLKEGKRSISIGAV